MGWPWASGSGRRHWSTHGLRIGALVLASFCSLVPSRRCSMTISGRLASVLVYIIFPAPVYRSRPLSLLIGPTFRFFTHQGSSFRILHVSRVFVMAFFDNRLVFSAILFIPLSTEASFFLAILLRICMPFWYCLWSRTWVELRFFIFFWWPTFLCFRGSPTSTVECRGTMFCKLETPITSTASLPCFQHSCGTGGANCTALSSVSWFSDWDPFLCPTSTPVKKSPLASPTTRVRILLETESAQGRLQTLESRLSKGQTALGI